MKPILFPAPLLHRNFVDAKYQFTELIRNSPGGKVVALVGPTQVGKSLIFEQAIKMLASDLSNSLPESMPWVSLVVRTSNDGRISPKHLTLSLLKAVHHPMYEHAGELDELDHYRPSRGRDEGTMRLALEAALAARTTIVVLLDEAHHLTHTNNSDVRSNVIQSIKCLGALDRTLVLVGGYELAYRGLFDSAHFAGRLICVELPPYTGSGGDLAEWDRIMKFCSKYVATRPSTLLLDEAEQLLQVTNGCFGLLEKVLWAARSLSGPKSVDRGSLRAAYPLRHEYEAIRHDIAMGKQALTRLSVSKLPGLAEETESTREETSNRPFKRKPNRALPTHPVVADD